MKYLLAITCLAITLAFGQISLGQGTTELPTVDRITFDENLDRTRSLPRSTSFSAPSQSPMAAAIAALKSAKTDEQKAAAKEKVKIELEKQYDAFLAKDQTRVDQLFDRLKKLEEQLEKRKAAKDRLVELKLEMMVSQAEGLGWPTDNNQNFAPRQSLPMIPPPFSNNLNNQRPLSNSGISLDPGNTRVPSRSSRDPFSSQPNFPRNQNQSPSNRRDNSGSGTLNRPSLGGN